MRDQHALGAAAREGPVARRLEQSNRSAAHTLFLAYDNARRVDSRTGRFYFRAVTEILHEQ